MSIYRFNDSAVIGELDFRHTDGGGLRAYAFAREDAGANRTNAIKRLLTNNDMQWVPVQENGKSALEIRGLDSENQLLKLLDEHHAISDEYKQEASIGDKVSFWGKIKRNTLRWSGLCYFPGDVTFLYYTLKETFQKGMPVKIQSLFSGIFYAMGTPFILIFGRGDKSDFQLKDICDSTLHALEKEGFDIPEDAAIRAVTNGHNEGIAKKIWNFCERYPAEITNSMFGLAGSMMVWASVKDLLSLKSTNGDRTAHNRLTLWNDIALGCMTILAGLISVFVEEEVPPKDAPRKTGFARLWQLLKERPLGAAGLLLGISSVNHGIGTVSDWKSTRKALANPSLSEEERAKQKGLHKAIYGRGVFVASAFAAEGLMAVSSKGHGAGVKSDQSLDRSVYAVMADSVLRQKTPEARQAMQDRMAQLLISKKRLGGEVPHIHHGISKEMELLAGNNWMQEHHRHQNDEMAAAKPQTPWLEKTLQSRPAPELAAAAAM